MISNQLRGAVFFPWFLPSFSNLGYQARSLLRSELEADFSGQTWLVTGASTGIGREIALSAALSGARVICVARGKSRLESLAFELHERQAGNVKNQEGEILVQAADLSTVRNVQHLAGDVAKTARMVDVLVNNVGVMFDKPMKTNEGLDAAFATNLLGPYVLTTELMSARALDATSTVINMSSGGMYNVPLELEPLQGGRNYNGTLAYAYHKRAQVELNAYWRLRHEGELTSYVMHPGWVATPGVETAMPVFYRSLAPILRDSAAGADTALWLASERPDQDKAGGIWFDRRFCSAHYLPGTRIGATKTGLIRYLDEQVMRATRAAH